MCLTGHYRTHTHSNFYWTTFTYCGKISWGVNFLTVRAVTKITKIIRYMVLNFYREGLGGRGFVTVLPTIVLQVLLDRAHGELPSYTWTLISHWEKSHRKTGEIWRSVIATARVGTRNRRFYFAWPYPIYTNKETKYIKECLTIELGFPHKDKKKKNPQICLLWWYKM